jgi:hypothetical protein
VGNKTKEAVKSMRKKVTSKDWIATQRLVAVDKGGRKRVVSIRIGKPYRVTKQGWACPVDSGILGRHSDARGVDSFQALCLAISLVRALVEDFLEKGGRFLDPEDRTEWSRDAIPAIFGWKPIELGPLRE